MGPYARVDFILAYLIINSIVSYLPLLQRESYSFEQTLHCIWSMSIEQPHASADFNPTP
jgi:hypothetical protein